MSVNCMTMPTRKDRRSSKTRVPALANGDPAQPARDSAAVSRNGSVTPDGRRRRGSGSSSRHHQSRDTSHHRVDPISLAAANAPCPPNKARPQSHSFFDDSPTSPNHYSPKTGPRKEETLDPLAPDFSPLDDTPLPVGRTPPPTLPNAFKETSNASIQSQRKLAGFFGDEFLGKSSSGSTSEAGSERTQKGRKQSIGSSFRNPSNAGSNGTQGSTPVNGSSLSRPRSPGAAPTSDVTPWAFQEFEVSAWMWQCRFCPLTCS